MQVGGVRCELGGEGVVKCAIAVGVIVEGVKHSSTYVGALEVSQFE